MERPRHFEDYAVGQVLTHAVPRTVGDGERALYAALYPSRFALASSDEFARACGLPRSPIDELAAFHLVFGKTVPDVSLNAVANLGYAEARWLLPVWPGDTLTATSEVIGLRETSNGRSGVVWVRTTGWNQHGQAVMRYCRWVMVRKRRFFGSLAVFPGRWLGRSVATDEINDLAGDKANLRGGIGCRSPCPKPQGMLDAEAFSPPAPQFVYFVCTAIRPLGKARLRVRQRLTCTSTGRSVA